MGEFNDGDRSRLSDELIAAALWTLEGQIKSMGKLLDLAAAADLQSLVEAKQ
ncbi:hypothetical protein [Microbulbifer sp.]|uniref:hypothetical protein n=1 Tax=Microbulbifer sp. TaxID=1908541 RepID=UPI00258BBD79|nr:hypothetical protein [Microbulbifer sp.]